MKILVTGAAGFIGYHLSQRLLARGEDVIGFDNLNPYYDPALKRARLDRLAAHPRFRFVPGSLEDAGQVEALFSGGAGGALAQGPPRSTRHAPLQPRRPSSSVQVVSDPAATGSVDLILHLAAQAGVRYSLEQPRAYTESNITGFLNILEACRRHNVPRLIYTSSSSVYGGNTKTPFSVGDAVETPVSLYAATKRAGELMAHCYQHLFGFAATGLRFFTVYGPWARPDMAPFRFADAIAKGRRIDIYNYGRMERDFTYVGDIVESVVRLVDRPHSGHRIFNVGNAAPVGLLEFVHAIEAAMGRRARRRFLPMQAGDVVTTHADVEPLAEYTGFRPATPIREGVARFVAWYLSYYSGRTAARVA